MFNNKVHSVLNNKVPAINDKLNRIGYGGCGRFAFEMHKALKRVGINSAIVLVNEPYNAQAVQSLINRTGKTGINSAYQHMFKNIDPEYGRPAGDTYNGHVCLRFYGKLYDNNGEWEGKAISKHITVKTMDKFLLINRCWNSDFRRANHSNSDIIGTMEKFFDNLFNKHLRINDECT